jgi:hypothetical protein
MRNFEVINESDCTHEWSQKRRRGFEQEGSSIQRETRFGERRVQGAVHKVKRHGTTFRAPSIGVHWLLGWSTYSALSKKYK